MSEACKKCGSPIRKGANFCGLCGYRSRKARVVDGAISVILTLAFMALAGLLFLGILIALGKRVFWT